MYVLNIGRIEGILPEGVTRLSGRDMDAAMGSLSDAWLRVSPDGTIDAFGTMRELDLSSLQGHEIIDAGGGMLIPAFCDSHTHIIYAGSREQEFEDKIHGLSYEEIARRGGGILNSAARLAAESEDHLFEAALWRARDMMSKGTGAIEVKSGYGLSTESELKMLRVAARLADAIPARVVTTFLGAHAVPAAFRGRQGEYVDYLIAEMLPAVAAEGLARYVDVFCDRGFFTVDETSRILEAAARYGMKPK
ncbi:MAG: imidazolonepropionase, partial [Muribaculaceae bacterium]|nr:imidazolonepropionase [Muribaculaceae bacterium]